MIVATKQLFQHAYGKYAIGAYNINNLEQTMGLFQGCMDSKAPFIIQLSKGARQYTNKKMLEAMIRAFAGTEGVGIGKFGPALRGILSGGGVAPDLATLLLSLGREESLARLNDALLSEA